MLCSNQGDQGTGGLCAFALSLPPSLPLPIQPAPSAFRLRLGGGLFSLRPFFFVGSRVRVPFRGLGVIITGQSTPLDRDNNKETRNSNGNGSSNNNK